MCCNSAWVHNYRVLAAKGATSKTWHRQIKVNTKKFIAPKKVYCAIKKKYQKTNKKLNLYCTSCSVTLSCLTLCDPVDCNMQHARLSCPSPSPRVCLGYSMQEGTKPCEQRKCSDFSIQSAAGPLSLSLPHVTQPHQLSFPGVVVCRRLCFERNEHGPASGRPQNRRPGGVGRGSRPHWEC